MNCFPRDQSLSDLLYSTFVGNSALIPSETFGGKRFYCQMSCDLKVTNEIERCWGKVFSYITIRNNASRNLDGSLVKGPLISRSQL